jgi:hypothetical protein
LLFQSVETIYKEMFPPAANDLTGSAQARSNIVVVQSLGGQQDHLAALDLKIRKRIFASAPLQLGRFGRRPADHMRTWLLAWRRTLLNHVTRLHHFSTQ